MDAAWDEWLSSMGNAYEVVQPEFTWGLVQTDTTDHASWIYEIIDVVGSLTLHMESGALLVEVMTCPIHVLQIIGSWDSGGPVPRKTKTSRFF